MTKTVMHKIRDNNKLRADLRALAAAGSTVDHSVADTSEENTEVEICQVDGVCESMVFELRNGRTGYILDLDFTNQSSKTIYSCEIELRMGWEDASFAWLPDPQETGRTDTYFVRKGGGRRRVEVASECYCFPGGEQLEYPRELVLNHVLLNGYGLQPGSPLTGWLLATGGPMPKDLRHGLGLEPTIALIASNHQEYTAQIRLWTERLETEQKPEARMPDLYRNPLGFSLDSTVVVRNEGCATHIAKPLSQGRDRDDRILNLRHL